MLANSFHLELRREKSHTTSFYKLSLTNYATNISSTVLFQTRSHKSLWGFLVWSDLTQFQWKKKREEPYILPYAFKDFWKKITVAIAQKRTSKRTSNFSPSHLQTVVPHNFRLLDILLDECCESKHWCRYNIARGVSFIFIRDRKLTSDKRKMKVDKLRVIVCLSKFSARNNRLSQT